MERDTAGTETGGEAEGHKVSFLPDSKMLDEIRVSSKHELDEQTRTNYEQLFVRVCSQISAN